MDYNTQKQTELEQMVEIDLKQSYTKKDEWVGSCYESELASYIGKTYE